MSRTLKELPPGMKAVIKKINGNGAIRRRIVDMGLLPGVEIEMERYAPLGDPVEVRVGNTHLSLRKDEAAMIELD